MNGGDGYQHNALMGNYERDIGEGRWGELVETMMELKVRAHPI